MSSKIRNFKWVTTGVAAAFIICFVSLNTSATVAHAMEKIPLVGKLFQVITIREYEEESITAKVPEVENKDSVAAQQVNESAQKYIDQVMRQFKEEYKDYEGGFQSLDISYDILTDSDRYFVLDISALEVAASGYEFHRYYTIDKQTDTVITLKDMFPGKDYVSVLSEEIIRQMKEDKEGVYFVGEQEEGFEGFTKIAEDQSFYIDEKGNLVIAFDEGEVSPSYLGIIKFVIPQDVVEKIS